MLFLLLCSTAGFPGSGMCGWKLFDNITDKIIEHSIFTTATELVGCHQIWSIVQLETKSNIVFVNEELDRLMKLFCFGQIWP
jgi:hypothetical protein